MPLTNVDGNDHPKHRALRHARNAQCRVSALEQLPLLWVHRCRLSCRNTEEMVAKQLAVDQESAMTHPTRHLRCTVPKMTRELLGIPSRRRNLAKQVATPTAGLTKSP